MTLKNTFWKWFERKYCDEISGSDGLIIFIEKNHDRILDDFEKEVGL